MLYGAIEQGEEEVQVTLDPQFKDFLAAFYTEASAGLLRLCKDEDVELVAEIVRLLADRNNMK